MNTTFTIPGAKGATEAKTTEIRYGQMREDGNGLVRIWIEELEILVSASLVHKFDGHRKLHPDATFESVHVSRSAQPEDTEFVSVPVSVIKVARRTLDRVQL